MPFASSVLCEKDGISGGKYGKVPTSYMDGRVDEWVDGR